MRRRILCFVAGVVFLALLVPYVPATAEPVTLKVLDPRGEIFVPPVTPLTARLDTLAGKKVGILRNTKPGADSFAPYLEAALKGVYPDIQFRTWVIPYNDYPNKQKDLKALAEWADAVIGMMGD